MATEDEKKDETAAASEPAGDDVSTEKVAVATEADEKLEPEASGADAPMKPMAVGAEEEENLVAEPDRVNVGIIGALTLAIIVATVAVVIGVQQFFTQTIAGEVNKKLNEPEDPLKKELYAVETAKLHKYQWASQKDGIVRIPVERARELVLADYGKMAAYQPGALQAPAPPTLVTPEPATSASAAPSTSVSAAPSGAPAPSGSVAPEASTLKPGLAPSTSASVPHKH
jgi:hypothetical protein